MHGLSSARVDWHRLTWALVFRDVCFALVLCTAVVVGMGELIVVQNESVWRTMCGFAMGAAVQMALYPFANLVRMFCQLSFTYQIVRGGMSARKVLATWSALYSASLRGLEDMVVGANAISFMVIVCLVAQAVIIGAIGNLYVLKPTWSENGGSSWIKIQRTRSDEAEFYSTTVDMMQANLGTSCSETIQNAAIFEEPNVTCTAAGCIATAYAAYHPILKVAYNLPYTISDVELAREDVIRSQVSGARVTIDCTHDVSPLHLYDMAVEYETPSWVNRAVKINGTFPDGRMFRAGDGSYGILFHDNAIPYREIGLIQGLELVDPTSSFADLPFVDDHGNQMFLMFAKGFPQAIQGFTQYQDPSQTTDQIGINLCSVALESTTVNVELEVEFTEPSLRTKLLSSQLVSIDHKIDLAALEDEWVARTQSQLSFWLSCYFWFCPVRADVLPEFNLQCGLLEPNSHGDIDYEGQLAKTISSLAKLNLMQHAGFMLGATDVAGGETVPYKVHTLHNKSRLVTTNACNIILMVGVVCSTLLIILHVVIDLAARKWPALERAMEMTDSVYALLAAFDSNLIRSESATNTTSIRRALRGTKMVLGGSSSGAESVYGSKWMIAEISPNVKATGELTREERALSKDMIAIENGGKEL
ncbi:hypothetical protein DFS34DRAFT_77488 [Phlyctochytrium arcticum]|nr:hypothetical protein DFS34DRAFT_77488 [Phlyctochytrium arcticum]